MAYRELRDGDLVRITDRGPNHGRDAVVIDASDGNVVRVQMRIGRGDAMMSECAWVRAKELLIREDSFVKDAREDHKALEEHRLRLAQEARDRQDQADVYDDDEEPEEACGECSCCKYHMWHAGN